MDLKLENVAAMAAFHEHLFELLLSKYAESTARPDDTINEFKNRVTKGIMKELASRDPKAIRFQRMAVDYADRFFDRTLERLHETGDRWDSGRDR